MRLVRDVAGHHLSVRINSNDESAAVITEQCLQSRLLIFGMILLGKQQLDCFLACDRRAFVGRNESQLRRLIVPLENTAHLRVGCACVRWVQNDDSKNRKNKQPVVLPLHPPFLRSPFHFGVSNFKFAYLAVVFRPQERAANSFHSPGIPLSWWTPQS